MPDKIKIDNINILYFVEVLYLMCAVALLQRSGELISNTNEWI